MVKKYIKRLNIGYEWLENNSESLMGKGPERVAAKPFPPCFIKPERFHVDAYRQL